MMIFANIGHVPRLFKHITLFCALLLVASCVTPRESTHGGDVRIKRHLQAIQYGAATPSLVHYGQEDSEEESVDVEEIIAIEVEEEPVVEAAVEVASFLRAKVKVALLLPFSGKNAALAKSAEHAVRLAILEHGEAQEYITLIPVDTAGTIEGGELAAEQLIAKDVDLIIGPMVDDVVEVVAKQAVDNEIPMIALSNNPKLLEQPIFTIGYNERLQVKRVLNYAYQSGIRQFSALVRNTAANSTLVDQFNDSLRRRNIRPRALEYYESNDEQLSRTIERVTFVDPSLPKQRPNSQGLLVTEGGRSLLTVLARLNRRTIDSSHMRLLGTNSWNQAFLLNEPRLSGGWFAAPPPNKVRVFKERFVETYGYEPSSDVLIAYDAITVVIELLATPNERPFAVEAMTRPQGFSGATGVFRFGQSRAAEHALAVVEVIKGKLKLLDPAPTVFIEPSTL